MKETSEVLQSLVSANFLSIDEARAILADKDPQVGAALSRNGNGVNKMVAHGTAEVTISTSPVVKARTLGYAFFVRLVSLNGNGGMPSITVKLKGAGPSGADLTHAINAGAGAYFPASADMTGNATSITVMPDATSDVQVIGLVVAQ